MECDGASGTRSEGIHTIVCRCQPHTFGPTSSTPVKPRHTQPPHQLLTNSLHGGLQGPNQLSVMVQAGPEVKSYTPLSSEASPSVPAPLPPPPQNIHTHSHPNNPSQMRHADHVPLPPCALPPPPTPHALCQGKTSLPYPARPSSHHTANPIESKPHHSIWASGRPRRDGPSPWGGLM